MPQQVIEKDRSVLKPDPNNPRKQADPEYIGRLAADIRRRGVLVPLIIRPEDVIIDGWCRWLAAEKAALEKLPCIVTSQTDPCQILAMQMATVMHRADISGWEKWQACERMRALDPKLQQKDVALALSLSESMAVRLFAPGKCIPAWQEALKEGKVGISDCYAASKLELEPEAQAGLLALKLSGATRDQIEQAGRKKRNGAATTAIRVSRIKCQVPGKDATVVVSGEAISLEDMIEAITELLKEAKKASERGLDAKTFERVCRDLAKKA